MQGNGVHATERGGKIRAVAGIQNQWRLAVRTGLPVPRGQCVTKFEVIVDLAIGDQMSVFRSMQGLVTGIQIDNCQPGLHEADIPGQPLPLSVWSAMGHGGGKMVENALRYGIARPANLAGDTTHQLITFSKN